MQSIYHRCPSCRKPVSSDDRECPNCGASLYIHCLSCGRETFIQMNCRYCRASLYAVCPNEDCRLPQLISPDGKCRSCGTKIT